MKLNFNFSGKTLLKDWWKTVRDNFTTIQTDHNTLSDKLDTEITQRTNADVGLADKITAEKTARENADSSLQKNINDETKNRQTGDSELQQKISAEITERQTADSKKADKTELYGTDETTKHTVTYSLTAADMAVSIDAGHSTGTVTVAGNTVKSKILLDGYSIQAADLSAMFSCGKGEDGDKYICIYYSPETGTLTMTVEDVETSPEEGTIALMTVGYNTATVTTMYNRAQTFTGINNLNGLKTDNKNSFLEAVNEIATKLTTEISDRMDENDSLSDRINTETGERQAADMQLSARINSIGNKAPLNHASTGTTYGVGDATNYGHLKLSDSVSSSNSTGNGCAATPKATKTAYDKAVEAYELADGKLDANFVSNDYVGIDEVTTTLSDMWSDRVAPPTTITISSSTSKHMLTADYYCSGTNDQAVINNAISALPSTGGKIVLLEGTYNIGGTITINKSNVTIQGLGHNVILKTATSTTALKMFGISNATGLIISDIVIDYANNTSADCIAIQLYSSDNVIIEHINILNNKGNGIEWFNCNYTRFSDISFINVRQCIWDRGRNHSSIIDKWIVDTVTNGIALDSSSTLNKIVDCIVRSATDNGIKSDAAYTMINDNIVYGCSNGITVNGNCSTVADNNVRDSDIGISVNGKYVNVSGNTAIRADDSGNVSSYSSSQYTISMGSSSANCLVIGNIISGKNYTNNGASTNTFANNKY